MHSKIRWNPFWLFLIIPLGLFTLMVLTWKILLWNQAPEYSGQKKIPGIGNSVRIVRDSFGVPHIQAKDSRSGYFALGYVTAQDRLFQMELMRRLSQGRLAEILGEDLVPNDKMFRALELKSWAEEYADDSKNPDRLEPEAWANLDAYLEGVNAFIAEGSLPIEYTVLGFKPEPFQRVDTLSTLAYMGFSFAEGIRSDSLYSILEEKLPNRDIRNIFPRYDLEDEGSIWEDQPEIPQLAKSSENPKQNSYKSSGTSRYPDIPNKDPSRHFGFGSKPEKTNFGSLHRGIKKRQSISVTGESGLVAILKHWEDIFSRIPIYMGSNSWVLSAQRTETGLPILVNDPHIGYSNPGTWFEAHLDIPGSHVYGYFLPGSPFPLIGNSSEKAWGLTMLENDDLDLYYETLSEDETRYLQDNRWKDLEIREEKIFVKGESEPVLFHLKKTGHGPIFSEFLKEYNGRPVSIYWAFHKAPNPLVDLLYKLLKAKSPKEMREGAGLLIAPGLNISYADRNGNIAWWAAGRFPVRKKPVLSRKILEGTTSEHDVIGFLPFSQNPQLENPKNGIIATANNQPSRKSFPGIGKLEGNWFPNDRFLRIRDLLSKKGRYNFSDMEEMLLDVYTQSAPEIWAVYLSDFDFDDPVWERVSREERYLAAQAIKKLSGWDFISTKDSIGASIYHVLTYQTMRNLWLDEMGDEILPIYLNTADHFNAFKALVLEPKNLFWDDLQTEDRLESRKAIINRALLDTVRYLKERVSESPGLWAWGRLHEIEYQHAFGRKPPMNYLFNLGPFSTWGAVEVVNNVRSNRGDGDWKVKVGPSTRRIVSFGNLNENRTILPIGNSGNLASPFYGDQIQLYLEGKFRKTVFDREVIEREAVYILDLVAD